MFNKFVHFDTKFLHFDAKSRQSRSENAPILRKTHICVDAGTENKTYNDFN